MSGGQGGGRERRSLWPVVAVGFVLAIQAVVLAWTFNPVPHNGGDNAAYLALGHSLLERGAYLELWDPAEPPHTKYPPLFPGILALLMALGARTWVAFKLVGTASALLVAALAFLLARRRVSLPAALAVALITGLSPGLLASARWIWSDLPFLALSLLGLWALDGQADRRRPALRVLGVGAAVLAFFTRSAGLPLLVAILCWAAAGRRWRLAGGSLLAFLAPALLWNLRSRGARGPGYVSEFWLVNPYDPAQGTVGVGGLVQRVLENAQAYTVTILPEAVAGVSGPAGGFLGILLVGLALAGWIQGLLRRGAPGILEWFAPLYAGLILVWPTVWSSDRFLLPLIPALLILGARGAGGLLGIFAPGRAEAGPSETAAQGPSRASGSGSAPAHGWRWPALAGAVVVAGGFTAGAWGSWERLAREGDLCARAAEEAGPMACYGAGWVEFASAAHWSGAHLPDGAAVLSRKPRLFYVFSGVPSLTFPFSRDPEPLYRMLREREISHLLVDRVDGLASAYLVPGVMARPDRFCSAGGWSATAEGGTNLLGVLPESAGGPGASGGGLGAEGIQACGPDRVRTDPRPRPPYGTGPVPLLSPSP